MESNNFASRLKLFIDHEGLTNSQFADVCGIPRPSLSQLLSGRNKKISNAIMEPVHAAFPNLSIMWLMFGEGDMLSHSRTSAPVSDETHDMEDVSPYGNFEGGSCDDSFNPSVFSGLDSSSKSTLCNNPVAAGFSMQNDLRELKRRNKEMTLQLEALKREKRRVKQITVYYDDSTFETFFPGQ